MRHYLGKVIHALDRFPDTRTGLEAMRAVMQSGIRPLVMRLYDPEDTAFSGHDLPAGGSLLQFQSDAVDNFGDAWRRPCGVHCIFTLDP